MKFAAALMLFAYAHASLKEQQTPKKGEKKHKLAEVEQKYDIDQVGTGFFDSTFKGPVSTTSNMISQRPEFPEHQPCSPSSPCFPQPDPMPYPEHYRRKKHHYAEVDQ